MSSHYDILGVSEKATKDEIKKAYRDLCMKHHPDLTKSVGSANAERFKQISAAHAVLSNVREKRLYDFELKEGKRFGFDRSGSGSGRSHGGGRERAAGAFTAASIRPRHMIMGVLGFTAVSLIRSFVRPEEDTSGDSGRDRRTGEKVLVEAWKNPDTGRWERPAPWSERYRSLKPKIEMIPRDQVVKAHSGRR